MVHKKERRHKINKDDIKQRNTVQICISRVGYKHLFMCVYTDSNKVLDSSSISRTYTLATKQCTLSLEEELCHVLPTDEKWINFPFPHNRGIHPIYVFGSVVGNMGVRLGLNSFFSLLQNLVQTTISGLVTARSNKPISKQQKNTHTYTDAFY